ncbi:MAG: hypothetical protein HQK99_14555 [Nitrospirae bacterium]|nr:hypothetical protein [Nitrospirota bacterium]
MSIVDTIYQKELVSLGLKGSQISTVIDNADVFQGMPRGKGYAIAYNFNQAVFVVLGAQLIKLGVSARNMNRALVDISHVDFGEEEVRANIYGDPLFTKGETSLPPDQNPKIERLNNSKVLWVAFDVQLLPPVRKVECHNIVTGKTTKYTEKRQTAATLTQIVRWDYMNIDVRRRSWGHIEIYLPSVLDGVKGLF